MRTPQPSHTDSMILHYPHSGYPTLLSLTSSPQLTALSHAASHYRIKQPAQSLCLIAVARASTVSVLQIPYSVTGFMPKQCALCWQLLRPVVVTVPACGGLKGYLVAGACAQGSSTVHCYALNSDQNVRLAQAWGQAMRWGCLRESKVTYCTADNAKT